MTDYRDPDECPSCGGPGYARIRAQHEANQLERERWYARRFFVYRAFDADGRLLYVGMTCSPRERWMSHKRDSGWAKYAARFRLVGPLNRDTAKGLERRLIASEHPLWNVLGRGLARPDVERYVAQRQAAS